MLLVADHDSSTRCDHCRTCHQTMMHNWQINRHLSLIINWILSPYHHIAMTFVYGLSWRINALINALIRQPYLRSIAGDRRRKGMWPLMQTASARLAVAKANDHKTHGRVKININVGHLSERTTQRAHVGLCNVQWRNQIGPRSKWNSWFPRLANANAMQFSCRSGTSFFGGGELIGRCAARNYIQRKKLLQ